MTTPPRADLRTLAAEVFDEPAQEWVGPPVDVTQQCRRVQTPQGERIAYLPPGTPIPADWTLL